VHAAKQLGEDLKQFNESPARTTSAAKRRDCKLLARLLERAYY
jgi:hypothetical protein